MSAPVYLADRGVMALRLDSFDSSIGCKRTLLSSWLGFVDTSSKDLFVVLPANFDSASKETLVSLLDMAEELGCERAQMVVDSKREDFRLVTKMLSFCGWSVQQSEPNMNANGTSVRLVYEL